MVTLLLYCRGGFEKECAGEIKDTLQALAYESSCRFEPQASFVLCDVKNAMVGKLASQLRLRQLVFARQMVFVCQDCPTLPESDRVSPLLDALEEAPEFNPERLYSQLFLEAPDTNDGKKLLKFARKFALPFGNKLKQRGFKRVFSRHDCPQLHVFFTSYQRALIGFSYPPEASPHPMGIIRLKFPHDAPSRSTLKLEEAFFYFLTDAERQQYLSAGMQAVDLGACPGGWSYQLLRRGLYVTAVDNGQMAESLMATGLLTHLPQDAFKFVPKRPVDWLVCDMVEQPSKVIDLLAKWLSHGWCRFAVVNLKLPMKKRWEELAKCLSLLAKMSSLRPGKEIFAKQLYHDREEVTVFVRTIPEEAGPLS